MKKYPKAGDLQRELATELTGNPTQNPWEVHSSSGLEGVFAQQDDAEFFADEIKRSGATGVTARRRAARVERSQVGASATGNPPFVLPVPGQRIRSWDHGNGTVDRICEEGGDGSYVAHITLVDGQKVAVPVTRTEYDFTPRKSLERRTGFSRHEQAITPASPDRPSRGTAQPMDLELDDTILTPRQTMNPSRVLREKWGDASEIVIESGRFGYTGWLESKRGGGRLPISFGSHKPTNAREALELAKKFLRAAHGRTNPDGDRDGTQEIKLKDRHSGGHVWLTVRNGVVVGVMGSDPKRYLGMSLERAKHIARHGGAASSPGAAARKNYAPEDAFDTDILDGMDKAIWVTAYASWVEEMSKEEREEHGDVPVNLSGIEWSDAAPPSPASSLSAAEDLYLLIERANGKTPGELFQEACRVDGCRANDANAELFGHYLAMQAMDHGVSWFDDHKEFPLKFPRHFEAHTHDGEEVEWSPKIKSTQNPEYMDWVVVVPHSKGVRRMSGYKTRSDAQLAGQALGVPFSIELQGGRK